MSQSIDTVRFRRLWPERGPIKRLSKRVIFIDGFALPAKFTARYFGRDGVPDVELVVEVAADGGLTPVKMIVERHLGAVTVNTLRVPDLALVAAAEAAFVRGEHPDIYGPPQSESELLAMLADLRQALRPRRTVTRELLETTADVYRRAVDKGDAPVVAVANHVGKSRDTAAKYVQRARAAGLLPATTAGKARA